MNPPTLTAEQLKTHDHRQPANFFCEHCQQTKPIQAGTGCGTGYARTDSGLTCYECCGLIDAAWMREKGRIALYLTCAPAWHERKPHKEGAQLVTRRDRAGTVTNWPGTLRFTCLTKTGRHNIAGTRYDCWFVFEGYWWHGVTFGDSTQVCHCRRTRERVHIVTKKGA